MFVIVSKNTLLYLFWCWFYVSIIETSTYTYSTHWYIHLSSMTRYLITHDNTSYHATSHAHIHTHTLSLSLSGSMKMSTITDSSGKSYSYPSPGLNPGSAALTAVGGVLCGLLGVGIGLTFALSNFILFNKLYFILQYILFKLKYIILCIYDRALSTLTSYSTFFFPFWWLLHAHYRWGDLASAPAVQGPCACRCCHLNW